MDDNNKYNKSKDYEPDNFDDEVAFPTRRSNPAKKPVEDYGDSFGEDIMFPSDYDEDAVHMPEIDFDDDMATPVKMPSERDDIAQAPDYGDNFDSQTGEQVSKATKDFQYDLSADDRGNYYTKSTIRPERKKVVKKKKRTSRNMAVILTIAAVICLIIAVVFAFTQCSSQKKDEKVTTSQVTTEQPTTEYGDDNYVPVYTEEPTYEPETEYVPETEAPVQTEPQTEYVPETELPQSSDISTSESSQVSEDLQPTQAQSDNGDEPYVEEN